jgi:hypothetical protein
VVVVRLAGGLGNQMFQYAAGRALAQRWQTELRLDLGFFSEQNLRAYSLHGFNIHQRIASHEDVRKLTVTNRTRSQRWVKKLMDLLRPSASPTVVKERSHLRFDPRPFRTARDVYLTGYWQSVHYFEAIANLLRKEFTLRQEQLPDNQALEQQIVGTAAIGVHVRRGDYVANTDTNQFHGVCSLDYYHSCARSLLSQVPNAHFFVFSDDPGWAKAHLQLGGPTTVVEPSGADRDHEQLLLLSRCQHLILANSTFSWWAAWLGHRPSRQVYAPRRWFARNRLDTREFIPSSWIRV